MGLLGVEVPLPGHEKPERFDVVCAWCPENNLLHYQCLTDKAFSWKEVSAQKCMALLHHVSPHKALLPCIANPIVKHLLGLLAKMMLVAEGLAEDFRGPAAAWMTRAVADGAGQKRSSKVTIPVRQGVRIVRWMELCRLRLSSGCNLYSKYGQTL